MKEFPSNLMTPVDQNYLKKIVRRARQNRLKRIKTAAAKQQQQEAEPAQVQEEAESEQEDEEEEEETPEPRLFDIPTTGTKYDTLTFNKDDFGV